MRLVLDSLIEVNIYNAMKTYDGQFFSIKQIDDCIINNLKKGQDYPIPSLKFLIGLANWLPNYALYMKFLITDEQFFLNCLVNESFDFEALRLTLVYLIYKSKMEQINQ
jgi:hypothetical protein